MRDKARDAAERLLETKTPVEIIDGYIVPALDEVGRDFEKGKKFLPQLLLSADTVSRAFEAIREHLEKTGAKSEPKGTILIATVQGDIHDIGKNIVKAMLENYGYTVVDLGKDVAIESVVEAVRKESPALVGLSALMTTTVSSMEKTINRLREENIPLRIMVGGASAHPRVCGVHRGRLLRKGCHGGRRHSERGFRKMKETKQTQYTTKKFAIVPIFFRTLLRTKIV